MSSGRLEDRWVRVDGLNIRYLEAGTGPAVMLLHGASLGSSAEVWEGVMTPLAGGGHRVLAYDQPGYGLSDNPSDYSLAYRTAFITKLMDGLGIERATLVGHSQAGGMAVRVAMEQAHRVTGVAVVCTGTLLPPLAGSAPAGPRAGAEETARSDATADDVRKLLEADVYHQDLVTAEAVERRRRLSVGKNVSAAAGRAMAREPQQDAVPLWRRTGALPVPLLMLYGDCDRASAGARASLLKEQRPELDVEVVKDAAHLLMWDAPVVFTSRLLPFLAGAEREAAPASQAARAGSDPRV